MTMSVAVVEGDNVLAMCVLILADVTDKWPWATSKLSNPAFTTLACRRMVAARFLKLELSRLFGFVSSLFGLFLFRVLVLPVHNAIDSTRNAPPRRNIARGNMPMLTRLSREVMG